MFGTYNRLRVHVLASDLAVIKAASRKLARKARYARAQRNNRHAFYRAMLKEHAAARALYRDVMGGFL
jgi:hypothetical protein